MGARLQVPYLRFWALTRCRDPVMLRESIELPFEIR
jgi:hypothetical protein